MTSLLSIGSLDYYFGGSRTKTRKKSSKTSISDWDMDVQGPGFERGFDHVLENFFKTKLRKYNRFGSDCPPARRPG